MVHSGPASPMKTTQSPSLTLPVTAPPLIRSAGGAPDLDQTAAKLLSADLNSDVTQPSALTPAGGKPSVETPAKAPSSKPSPPSVWSPARTPTPARGQVNGRTSGRRRTPKACDCCGPNSRGHNVKTSSRGRGRGRGRGGGRGDAGDLWDTPKRKVGQLTQIKRFDLSKQTEGDDEDGPFRKAEASVAADDAKPQTPDVPIRNCVAQKKDASAEGSGEKGGRNGRDVEMRLLGMEGRGAPPARGRGRGRGRGAVTATVSSKLEVNFEMKRGGGRGVAVAQSAPRGTQIAQKPRDLPGKPSVGNGETVNLSDTEEEVKEDYTIVIEPGNGPLASSWESGAASAPGAQQDSEMEVDPDRGEQVSIAVTLCNGGRGSTPMEVGTSLPSNVSPPSLEPIAVSSTEHRWALRDHALYCQLGTWQEGDTWSHDSARQAETEGRSQEGENQERLIDLVHEFLESFYVKYGSFIPLTETDIREHLKTKGSPDPSDCGLDLKEQISRYRAGLASAPITGFLVAYNKHTLSLEDLGTLEEQNWLNDQIINMYGELIMEATEHKVHFFNSFFHKQLVAKGYDGVKRWNKKVDLFSKWLLLIPIHLEIHWSLVTVTMATKTISYYDSQGIVFRHTTDNIMKYLQSEAREKKLPAFQKGWKITIIKGIPQQKNDSDCGVFVLEYCRRLSVKQPLLFSQDDMPRIRKRIYKELCDCRLDH